MKKNKLSEVVFKNLIGKKIFNVGDNWIQLDNGLKIYLDNLEIAYNKVLKEYENRTNIKHG
jgi:hypothetical protein